MPDAPEGFENFAGLFRDFFRFGKGETRGGEEPSQQCGACRFVNGQKVFTRAGRDQMDDGPNYRGALLADIELRQVEAEDLGLADKIPQSPFSGTHPPFCSRLSRILNKSSRNSHTPE